MKSNFLICLAIMGSLGTASAQEQDAMKDCPMHEQHQAASGHDHPKQQLEKRGDQGMGFAQDKTTHHFLLTKDGGAIQVSANSADDKASLVEIRGHLKHISERFQAGDFNIPMFVHDKVPDGVPTMTRLKDQIKYQYQESEKGAAVLISTKDPEALVAIQQFLRFQIKEHETGDPLELK